MSRKNVEIRRFGGAEKALVDILATGGRDSKAAMAAMETCGFSAKQTRTARERLRVVIERQGNGRAMRSFWRLPDLTAQATPADDINVVGTAEAPVLGSMTTPPPSAGPRFARRVEFFVSARALAPVVATDLAGLLDTRDRMGDRRGACPECQLWTRPDQCSMQQPALALHGCDSARRDAP